ncbi:MAG: sensor histidine kinase [Paracoccaceae bacterium]|nr:sensor histidine kinase [Paracoccaceae bacterium]
MDKKARDRKGEVLLGEDWVAPDALADQEFRATRGRRSIVALNRSPLARKIIIFNLMALVILVAGVLYMNPFRDSLVLQREQGLVTEAQLIADVFEARIPGAAAEGTNLAETLEQVNIAPGVEVFVFDTFGVMLANATGVPRDMTSRTAGDGRATIITDFLNMIWEGVSNLLAGNSGEADKVDGEGLARELYAAARAGETSVNTARGTDGGALFSVATPIWRGGEVLGVVALTSAEGEIDRLVRYEREQVLQMFVIALLVSIGLSLVLASTIANPLSDLAAAAELGRDRDARKMTPGRVRIPDLTARPDEIGRLSVAMRGMVAALYDRIDANEQFAADVAHEIKNPLASLRSAVGTMRVAKREDQREKLLDVIEHDVRRLDRLVSDISNASRLDSELVKEEEEDFNLLKTLGNIGEYLGAQAAEKGIELITDLPSEPIRIRGLEARLAQVFVNLITNAISFCEEGDAVRVWARKRDNRVLVVVEDTGPGIPEQALSKVFKRFYSERPVAQFGDHSGLGLAISKQIVEAHGGVIWAENIRPTHADVTSEPLGARFVVGLPV